MSMRYPFKGKREDRRPEYGIVGAGVVMGATAGLGAPPGLTNHLAPQIPPRHTSGSIRRGERVADSKEGARPFTEKVPALLKGGGEAILRDDLRFEDVKVTRGSSKNKLEQSVPKSELLDFSQQDTILSTQNVGDIGEGIEDIDVYNCSRIRIMKAALDTQMEPNMICRTMAEHSQLSIKEYNGPEAQVADGRTFMPEGVVKVHFSFRYGGTGKTYYEDFLVAPETAPFDIILGREFIRRARVYVKNRAGYVVHFPKMTEEKKAELEKKKQKQKEENDALEAQRGEIARRKRQEQRTECNSSGSGSNSAGRSASGTSSRTG